MQKYGERTMKHGGYRILREPTVAKKSMVFFNITLVERRFEFIYRGAGVGDYLLPSCQRSTRTLNI